MKKLILAVWFMLLCVSAVAEDWSILQPGWWDASSTSIVNARNQLASQILLLHGEAIPDELYVKYTAPDDWSVLKPEWWNASEESFVAVRDQLTEHIKRNGWEENASTLLIDSNGITMEWTGEYRIYGMSTVSCEFDVLLTNSSDKEIYIDVEEASIDGQEVSGLGTGSVTAGNQKRETFTVDISDANLQTFDEIKDLFVTFSLYDKNTYEEVAVLEPVKIK